MQHSTLQYDRGGTMSRDMNHSLTLEEALVEWSHQPPTRNVRLAKSHRTLRPLVAPPPTPSDELIFFTRDYPRKDLRGSSFSSNCSTPGMVEDHSGTSDSEPDMLTDEDQHREAIDRIRNTYEITTPLQDKSSIWPLRHCPNIVSRPPVSCPSEAPSQRKVNRSKSKPDLRHNHSNGIRRSPLPQPRVDSPSTKLGHPPQPPNLRKPLMTQKSLPLPPRDWDADMPPPLSPLYSRRLEQQYSLPYLNNRPSTSPHSKQPFCIHATPALPPAEKSPTERSFFEYDTDDETFLARGQQLSSSLASKLHIRNLSLGKKSGLSLLGKRTMSGPKEYKAMVDVDEGGRRRRKSAGEIVRGVFGLTR